MRNITPVSVFAAFLLLAPIAGYSRPHPGRPRIGLALGGGGARGLAHIGVIQWMEEHHIPIDYIAGTSIGGLVGGAYAAGYSSEELARMIQQIDWSLVLRGSPRYSDLSFRRKQDQRAYPTGFEFGLRKGFRLPAALNPGHEVGLIFDHIALPYSEIGSFDELPTPFRCVAADLLTGRKIVLKDGSLGGALRATMAIPGVFVAVKRDDMMLVDGGIVDNLPVDVLKQMGADIIIAVDVGAPPPKAEDMESLLGVMDRALDIMIRANVDRNIRLAQVVLKPDVGGIGTLEFQNVGKIIEQGYQVAAGNAAELRRWTVNDTQWEKFIESRAAKRKTGKPSPGFIAVSGESPVDTQHVKRQLSGQTGKPLDEDKLATQLTEITGWGPYDAASYAETSRQGKEGLAVRLRRKSYGPPFLKPVFKINAGQSGNMDFEVAARATFYDVWNGNNELRADLSLGRLNLIGMELYQYLGDTGWFVAPRAHASYETQFLYQDADRIADYGVADMALGVDAGYNFGRSSELRAGYQWGYQKANIRSGDPTLPSISGQAAALAGSWKFDRLNSAMVATDGIALTATASWQIDAPGASSRFTQTTASLLAAHPLSNKWATQLRLAGGSTLGGNAAPIQQFTLGGPTRIGALGLGERRGNYFVYTSAGVLRLLKENAGGVVEKMYAGVWYEGGDAFNSRLHYFHSGSVGIVSETKLGIFFIGGSFGESGRAKFYLSLGKFF